MDDFDKYDCRREIGEALELACSEGGEVFEAIESACSDDAEGRVGMVSSRARAIANVIVAERLASIAAQLEAAAEVMRTNTPKTDSKEAAKIARYILDTQAASFNVIADILRTTS